MTALISVVGAYTDTDAVCDPHIRTYSYLTWEDIGVLASLDPVALDQACIDLIYQSNDPGRDHFVERVESRNGIHTIEAADALGFGSRAYTLIEVE